MSLKKMLCILLALVFIINLQPYAGSVQQESLLPSSFSWTDIDGIDYTTPIKNQAPAPTCEAYALCAALETLMQYQTAELFAPDLSEAHLYFYAGGTYDQGGVNVRDAANYLVEFGVPDEGCYPDPHRPFDYEYESVEDWPNRTVKISDWGYVPHEDEAIKQALIEYGPLTICIFVYADMYDYAGGVYRRSTDEIVGGHLVTLVGFDDEQQYWLVKNSWGESWGEDGWFLMGYDMEMFIDGCYGGDSGIIYVDGVYGNFKPDVPKINIISPVIYTNYIFNIALPQLIRQIEGLQTAAPRIIGGFNLDIEASNTERIEVFVDGDSYETISSAPFDLRMRLSRGLHTIEIFAYDEQGNESRDIVDVFVVL